MKLASYLPKSHKCTTYIQYVVLVVYNIGKYSSENLSAKTKKITKENDRKTCDMDQYQKWQKVSLQRDKLYNPIGYRWKYQLIKLFSFLAA